MQSRKSRRPPLPTCSGGIGLGLDPSLFTFRSLDGLLASLSLGRKPAEFGLACFARCFRSGLSINAHRQGQEALRAKASGGISGQTITADWTIMGATHGTLRASAGSILSKVSRTNSWQLLQSSFEGDLHSFVECFCFNSPCTQAKASKSYMTWCSGSQSKQSKPLSPNLIGRARMIRSYQSARTADACPESMSRGKEIKTA